MNINISVFVEVLKNNNWELLVEKNNNYDPEIINNIHEFYDPEFASDLEFLNEEKEYLPLKIYKTLDSELFNNKENRLRRMEELQHISEPKGIPDDISLNLKSLIKTGTFGHNWLTLNELSSFNWKKEIKRTAKVKPFLAPLFSDGKERFPTELWPADEKVYANNHNYDGATVSWVESYEETPSRQYLVEILENLKQVGNPNHVRILFWFNE